MKKLTLALLSVLAFGSAAAAQDSVTVYGRIDLGVGISRINDGFGSKENNAQMVTGAGTSNRIGIKGEEDLGSGYKIKFVLENGFDADTGAEATEGLAFSREASILSLSRFVSQLRCKDTTIFVNSKQNLSFLLQ